MTEERTPYGLEAHRLALLRRQRLLLLLLVVGLLLFWFTFFQVTTETQTSVSLIDGDGNQITITRPEQEEKRPVARLTVRPGETSQLDDPIQTGDPEPETSGGPTQPPIPPREEEGFPLISILGFLSPLLAIRWLLGRWGQHHGPLKEVNLGVYKGSFPYEMHAATHRKLVITGRGTWQNPFGKLYEDYIEDAFRR